MKKRILLVDDAAVTRLMLKKILSGDEYEIVGEASNGPEAIYKYQQLKPDLVTLDISMPDMDGLDVLITIKKMDPEAKIIMCSALSQKIKVLKAIKAGAINFIAKPFDGPKVIQIVNRALEISTSTPD
ncbi:MAG TPA: response regulator [Bacillota bacterium]|nr:response regulator [Bacillota bacterium]